MPFMPAFFGLGSATFNRFGAPTTGTQASGRGKWPHILYYHWESLSPTQIY